MSRFKLSARGDAVIAPLFERIVVVLSKRGEKEMRYQARRFYAWPGNMGDNAFLSWNELGPMRATPEEAFDDLRVAPTKEGEHPHYGREVHDFVIVLAPEPLIDS